MGWHGLYYVNFQSVGEVGLLGKAWHSIVHSISAFLAKERPGFCSTVWDPCGFMCWWCVSIYYCKFLCVSFSFSHLLQLNKWSVKVESINCYALPLDWFQFPCFHLFKENPWKLLALLSSSPVRSTHSFPLKASKKFPTLPQIDLCKSYVSSPHPKLPFPFLQQKTQKF